MKNGSAPGCDGLTTEFFKIFWNKIKAMLSDSYNYAFLQGNLAHSQQRGIITLLHKGKNLPRDNISNWRSITVLNTDYKLLAKTLSRRLSTTLNGLKTSVGL